MLSPMEKPLIFDFHGQKMSGMLHAPDIPRKCPAVVFLHGFSGNKVEPHRLFVKTARLLAKKKIASLRFDFRGSGDSEGDFGGMTVSDEVVDAARAFEILSRKSFVDPNRMAFLGFSLGGAVAACATAFRPRVKALALWAPLAQISRLFTLPTGLTPSQIRDWRKRGKTDYYGNELGLNWLRGLDYHDALESAEGFQGKVLIVHGGRDRAVPLSQSRLYLERLGRRARLHVVRGADHAFNSVPWEAEAIRTTVQWLKKTL
jgi:uncharacterized protein